MSSLSPSPSANASAPDHASRLAIASAVVSVVALAAVVWWAARQEAPTLPDAPLEIVALVAAVAVYALTTALRAERWQRLLDHEGAGARRADSYALTAVGFMGNNVLPARGGDIVRVYLLAPRVRTEARSVIGTLVAERVLDVAVLLGLFVVVAYGLLDGAGVPGTGRLITAAAIAALGALAIRVLWKQASAEGRVSRLAAFVRPMLRATVRLRGAHGAGVLGLTLLIWFTEAGTWYLCGVAADMGLSPLDVLYLISLASIFVLVPAGPGYAGTMDAAVIFGAHAIGADGSAAVSYLLLLRFVLLVPITGVGLVLAVVRYGGWRQLRSVWSRRRTVAAAEMTEG
jgi:uncharacterized membrane protein YbhN (UPF0104 family)